MSRSKASTGTAVQEHDRDSVRVPPRLPVERVAVPYLETPRIVRLDVRSSTAHAENGLSSGPLRTTAFHTVS